MSLPNAGLPPHALTPERAADVTYLQVVTINAWVALRGRRGYQLEDANGEKSFYSKWDTTDSRLALLCLVSPLHLPLTILRGHFKWMGESDEMVATVLAVLHGYLNLLLAHKFLQRQTVDAAIFRSALFPRHLTSDLFIPPIRHFLALNLHVIPADVALPPPAEVCTG